MRWNCIPYCFVDAGITILCSLFGEMKINIPDGRIDGQNDPYINVEQTTGK